MFSVCCNSRVNITGNEQIRNHKNMIRKILREIIALKVLYAKKEKILIF